ncbi:MAG: flavodoxin domain-containing protein [Chloroflexota bacterium]
MRALVVYESMFGNTEVIARAVAEGLAADATVEVVEVGAASPAIPGGVDLLVVGGPTHAHGLSKPESRADSARRAGDRLVSRGSGIREWLGTLRAGSVTVAAAAFDTRIKGPGLLWGSAAKGADKRLREVGFRLVAGPESFLVEGPTGPLFDRLVPGETDRARRWGETLGAGLRDRVPAGR